MKYVIWNKELLHSEEVTEEEVIRMIHNLKDGDTIELSRLDVHGTKRIVIDTY